MNSFLGMPIEEAKSLAENAGYRRVLILEDTRDSRKIPPNFPVDLDREDIAIWYRDGIVTCSFTSSVKHWNTV